jgi:hypothetical protein
MAFKARFSAVVLLLVGLGCTQEGAATRLARNLEYEFSKQLTSGASKAAVVAFLNEHRIQYVETPRRRMISGWIPDVQKDVFGKGYVHLNFFFDDNDRLTKHEIVAEYTAL